MKNFYTALIRTLKTGLLFTCLFCMLHAAAQTPGNALNFDGTNDYIKMTGLPIAGKNFTIEFWINTTQSGANPTSTQWYNGTGLVDGEVGGITNDFGISLVGSKIIFGTGNPDISIISNSNVNTGHWVHVAAERSYPSGQIKLYINGVLEKTANAGTGILQAPQFLTIGTSVDIGRFFAGSMDELRFFNSDRSANILSDMVNTIPVTTDSLAAYYNFEQGIAAGTNTGLITLPDLTNNKNLTLNNFALTGATSNWVTSYAMVIPQNLVVSSVTPGGFKLNWAAPAIGINNNYLFDLSTSPTFATLMAGYSGISIPTSTTTLQPTGLTSNTQYYYRLSANRTDSVPGQGAYATGSVTTVAVPVINSFSPLAAGTDSIVTIKGHDFTGVSTVTLGGTAAASFTVVNDTIITAKVATGTTGIIAVANPQGYSTQSSATFTYLLAPVVTGFTPSSALTGVNVTISGSNFTGVTGVKFGGVNALSFTFVNDNTVTAKAAPNSATGNISVIASGGTGASADVFTFQPTPAISSFSPASAKAGATITINGTNFTGATGVSFGGNPAKSFTVTSATVITAVADSGATGPIAVTNPYATGTSSSSFTYIPPFTITSCTPGTAAAGAPVTIKGTSFTGTTAVKFGTGTAISFTVVNDSTINAVVGQGSGSGITLTGGGVTTTFPSLFVYSTTSQANALSFDGGDDVTTSGGNPIGDNFTIEFWVKTTQTGNVTDQWYNGNRIVDADAPNIQNDYGISLNGSKLAFGIGRAEVSHTERSCFFCTPRTVIDVTQTEFTVKSASNINTGKWVHVTAVRNRDAQQILVYINGVLENTVYTDRTVTLNASSVFRLGPGFNGLLDEMRFFNTLRSSSDIVNDMRSTVPLNTDGLVAYYNFNQGVAGGNNTGNTALIDTKGSYNSTLSNFALTGSASNWVQSYAMFIPVAKGATDSSITSLTAGWSAPASPVDYYLLDVSAAADFSSLLTGYNQKQFTDTSAVITGLSPLSTYYFRVRAVKTSEPGGIFYSNTAIAHTINGVPVITSFSPRLVHLGDAITIKGSGFAGTSSVSIGSTQTTFTLLSDTVILAATGRGIAGKVSVTTSYSTAVSDSSLSIIPATPPGNALNFDGQDDNVSIPRVVSGDFTIEYWLKTTQTGPGNNNWPEGVGIVDGEVPGIVNDFGSSLLRGKLAFGQGNPSAGGDITIQSLSNVNTGHWVHVALVRDSVNTQLKIYINGVLEATGTGTSSSLTAPSALLLGHVSTNSYYFSGSIDELRFFTTNRSANIAADMVNTRPDTLPGLAAYYSFDEGTPGGNNSLVTSLYNLAGNDASTLNNFALAGPTSNWAESYAMVQPVAGPATNIAGGGFTANWHVLGSIGADTLKLDISTTPDFSSFVTGYNGLTVTGTGKTVTGLIANTRYYYRVWPYNTLVQGQGMYSNIDSVKTPVLLPVITSASSTAVYYGLQDTIRGANFTGASSVSFGGTAPLGYTVVSDSIIIATAGTIAAGPITVTTPSGTATSAFSCTPSALTPPGNTLNFNGSAAYVAIPRPVSGNFTIEYWLKTTQTGPNTNAWPAGIGIVDGEVAGITNDFGTSLVGGRLAFGQGNPAIGNDITIISASAVNTGRWVHVAVVRDSANAKLKMYINGVLEATGNGAGNSLTAPASLLLGRVSTNAYYLNGNIDELRFFNTDRSAYIQADMKDTIAGNTPGLVAYYNFDEGMPGANNSLVTTLIDKTGNNNGTLNNFPLTGNTGNWVTGGAMIIPVATAANNVKGTSFTANWQAPKYGSADYYYVTVARDSAFTNIVSGYSDYKVPATSTSLIVTGVGKDSTSYYHVRADKEPVTGEYTYSNTISIHTVKFDVTITHSAVTSTCMGEPTPAITAITKNGVRPYTLIYTLNGVAQTAGGNNSDTIIIAPPANVAGRYCYIITGVQDATGAILSNYDSSVIIIRKTDSVTVPVTVNSPALPYIWNGHSYTQPGNYTIHFSNTAGCDSAVTLALTIHYPSASTTAVIICSTALPYVWNGTQYKNQGTYTVHLVNQYGLDSAATLTLRVSSAMKATYTSSLAQLCYGTTANSNVTVINGIKPYQYSIDNGTTWQPATSFVVQGGVYHVTVKDSIGCTAASNTLTIVQPAAPLVLDVVSTRINCINSVTLNTTGGFGSYTYSVKGGPYQAASSFTGLAPDAYNFAVQDANGCRTNKSITISGGIFSASATASKTQICNGASTTSFVSATGGTKPYSYSIDNGASYQTAASFKVTAGTYNIKVVDAKGCDVTTNVLTISQAQPIAATPAVTMQSCDTGTVTLTVTGGYGNYTFSKEGGPYQSSMVFSNTQSGLYHITIKDTNGCATTKTVRVGAVTPLSATYKATKTIACTGKNVSALVTAAGGMQPYQYSGDSGATYQAGRNFTLYPGNHTVKVTDAAGCNAISNILTITEEATPVKIIATYTNETCLGQANGAITATASGGIAGYMYKLNSDVAYKNTNVFTNLAPGSDTARVIDSAGCTAAVRVIIKAGAACSSFKATPSGESSVAGGTTAFAVHVMPNPTVTDFFLTIEGGDEKAVAEIVVMDINGKKVYQTRGSTRDGFRFGRSFTAGLYIAEVLNGKNVARIKLVKGN